MTRTSLTLLTSALLVLSLASSSTHAGVDFHCVRGIPTDWMMAVEVADFDEDGFVDIVSLGRPRNYPPPPSITVRFGPDLARSTHAQLGGWQSAGGMVLGDFDRNGSLDAAASRPEGDRSFLDIAPGDGAGGFGAVRRVEIVGSIRSNVTAGDFDGDGSTDLLYSNIDGYSVLLNDGTGSFLPPREVFVAGRLGPPIVADFDQDGRLDLAFSLQNLQLVRIFLGDGTGGFDAAGEAPTPDFAWELEAADFDGDGDSDIAASIEYFDQVLILLGDGRGGLSAPATFPVGAYPTGLKAGDLDGDGRMDVVADCWDDGLSILLGDGLGGFSASHTIEFAGALFAVADLDRDGRTDIVGEASDHHGFNALAIGWGAPVIGIDTIPTFSAGNQPHALGVADLNADGRDDVVVANRLSGDVTVLRGDDSAGLAVVGKFPAGNRPRGVAIADFDRDGFLDVAVANPPTASVAVLRGDGSGALGPPLVMPAGSKPIGVAAGDFDEDGFPDLAAASANTPFVCLLRGDGSGGFAPPMFVQARENLGWSLVAADLDLDGHLDLAMTSGNPASVVVLWGDGLSGFAAPASWAAAAAPNSVSAGDLNSDGWLDLLVAGSSLSSFLNDGARGFAPRTDLLLAPGFIAATVADLDQDGAADVVTSALNRGFAVCRGDGLGGIESPGLLFRSPGARPAQSYFLATGDFDGDGRLDVAGSFPPRDEIAVLVSRP